MYVDIGIYIYFLYDCIDSLKMAL